MTKFEWRGGLNRFYRKQLVDAALQLSSSACDVEYAEVAAFKRNAAIAFARQLAMYLCHVVGDMSLRDVAMEFGRDRTTVSHACHAIEDRRDCPIFDRQIDHLERELRRRVKTMVDQSAAQGARFEKKGFRIAW
jgi:chromosomal replication initiation ATPase DnaA